jgi:hypothetical protein
MMSMLEVVGRSRISKPSTRKKRTWFPSLDTLPEKAISCNLVRVDPPLGNHIVDRDYPKQLY